MTEDEKKLANENEQLKEQIEKMKRCANCNNCVGDMARICLKKGCKKYNKWQLKE